MIHEGHPGIVRMKMFARNYVWWSKLDQDLESKVQRCVACQSKRHSPAKAPLHPWEYPKRPWSRIHVDYAGPYQGKMLLVIVDAFTKWLEVHVMNSSTAEATVEKLRTTFATFGIPETVVSDNGTCFVSEVFQTFMSRNGIRHIKVAPKHPASNGLAERSVQSVKEGLNKMTTGSLETKLARFLFKYRNIPHSTTGKSPTELLFGRKVRTHLDHMHPDEAKAVEEQQLKQKVYHDRHAKDRQVNVGDPVYVTNFSSGPCWLPGVVVNKSGPVSFIVKLLDDRTVRRHQDHVRACRAQHFPEREVYDDVSERPIVGVVPAISTDQRVTESGSGEESSAAIAATNASAAETNEQTALNNTGNSVIPTTTQLRRSGRVRKPV